MDLLKSILDMKSSGKVLDLGSGEGALAVELAKKGYQVVAVDLRKEALHKLFNSALNSSVFVETVEKDVLNFRTGEKFDIVIMSGLLQFISLEKIPEFTKYLRDLTKLAGMHFITLPRDDRAEIIASELTERYKDWQLTDLSSDEEIFYAFLRVK